MNLQFVKESYARRNDQLFVHFKTTAEKSIKRNARQ